MKLTIRQIAELLGVVSIVASLIFVGMQLRLDQRMVLAEVYAIRSETRQANLRALLESEIALSELAEYRERALFGSEYSIPDAWKNDDPKITEARRIRIELIIMNWDNMAYQSALGLIDADPYQMAVRRLFVSDPDLKDFALNAVSINQYTRDAFEEIAAELGI